MSIIVDANCAADLSNKTDDGKPVLKWLLTGAGSLVLGGLLKKELGKAGIQHLLVVLDQAGRLVRLDDAEVDGLADNIRNAKLCVSNDQHVIAVAQISGCRLIFTRDQALHKDAKNTRLLAPAASIYCSCKHKHLLK